VKWTSAGLGVFTGKGVFNNVIFSPAFAGVAELMK
jgi:hypothetical protein